MTGTALSPFHLPLSTQNKAALNGPLYYYYNYWIFLISYPLSLISTLIPYLLSLISSLLSLLSYLFSLPYFPFLKLGNLNNFLPSGTGPAELTNRRSSTV
jgi:hypothetical protein